MHQPGGRGQRAKHEASGSREVVLGHEGGYLGRDPATPLPPNVGTGLPDSH